MLEIATALRQAEQQLRSRSPSARLDAEVLLAHVLGKPRSFLLAWPARRLHAHAETCYRELVRQRCRGRPVAYLTGEREFYSLALGVSADTLIPRPETELLVERGAALATAGGARQALDLGTGSGAIALALARRLPRLDITATDRSVAALCVAAANARRLGATRVHFLASDWFAALGATRYDLIVSNPPYVASDDPHLRRGDPRFEPRLALDGGADGLRCLRLIVQHAPQHLRAAGWLALEHGHSQGAAVRALLHEAGFGDVATHRDLAGLERATEGRAP